MEFGTLIFTKPQRAISDTRYAEERGFAQAWFPDSHMIWGDAYACMALGAANTKTIKLGTGISVAVNRIPPVTVHSIATINELAPGRVMLGFGTGHTGRRVMGLPPVKFAEFREEVRVIRDLLRDGEAIYNTEGLSRKIRYIHRERRFINLDDRIPLYVAANAPRALALAGEFGDGIITTGVATPERMEKVLRHAEVGMKAAGREARKMPVMSLSHICVLKPGEKIDSPRVAEMVGPWVITCLHAIAAGYAKPGSLPADARKVYDAYAEYVARMEPAEERYMRLHVGHCTYVPAEERRFVTPETIRATTIVGERGEVAGILKAMEKAGLDQVILNPAMDRFNETIDEISNELIGRG